MYINPTHIAQERCRIKIEKEKTKLILKLKPQPSPRGGSRPAEAG